MAIKEDGIWPNDLIFTRIIHHAKTTNKVIIDDPTVGFSATYCQLLSDVSQLRDQLLGHFGYGPEYLDRVTALKSHRICFYGHGNYEFAVAGLAVLALGWLFVPLPTDVEPEIVCNLLYKCEASCILTGSQMHRKALRIQHHASCNSLNHIDIMPVVYKCGGSDKVTLKIKESLTFPESQPSWVCWTSGSTGIPKGVLHNRKLFTSSPPVEDDSIILCQRPPFWLGGALPFITSLLMGRKVYVIEPEGGPDVIWKRIRAGDVTDLMSTGYMYEELARYYRDNIKQLPESERGEYLRGVQHIRRSIVGGAFPSPSLLQYWKNELRCPLILAYGSTETGGMILQRMTDTDTNIERCIGKPVPPFQIKLSSGDHGSIMVKPLASFLGYLSDEIPSEDLFDHEGYFNTNDTAHRVGDDYVFDGRASSDFIKTIYGPVPVLELQISLSKLPYILEVYICPVPDRDIGTRVGALVRFDPATSSVNLEQIRIDLMSHLPPFKLPTALRVLKEGEDVSRTSSQKVAIKPTTEKFFPCTADREVVGDVELWDLELNGHGVQYE